MAASIVFDTSFNCSFKLGKVTKSLTLYVPVTKESLENALWEAFKDLRVINCQYEIKGIQVLPWDITEGDTVIVKSKCKGFTEFKLEDVKHYALIKGIEIDDSHIFDAYKDVASSAERLLVDSALEPLLQEVLIRLRVINIDDSSECTMREFISCVLVHALNLAGKVQMVDERPVNGSEGWGPVDYAMIYKSFYICIAEAKKDDLVVGVNQNIGQLIASREVYAASYLGKRKREEYEDESWRALPSSGIVTSGHRWIFTRYIFEEGRWKLYRTNAQSLALNAGMISDSEYHVSLMRDLRCIMKQIVCMLLFQIGKVDGFDAESDSKLAKV
jgi:hypothetical protein